MWVLIIVAVVIRLKRPFFLMMLGTALTGCATAPPLAAYTRVDGRAVDNAQLSAVLAQCQGEGAASVDDQAYGAGAVGLASSNITRSNKQVTITRACMARNGYIAQ
jgi:hypothetical protein